MMFITISAAAYLLVNNLYHYEVIIVPVIIYQVLDFFKFHKKAQQDVEQFVESIHYRDFSRNFDVKHAPQDLQRLRKGFNDINTTFKVISKEKETQLEYPILSFISREVFYNFHGFGCQVVDCQI